MLNNLPPIYCAKCGAYVEHPTGTTQKYCAKCSPKKVHKGFLGTSRTCDRCGKEFSPKAWNQRFCPVCGPVYHQYEYQIRHGKGWPTEVKKKTVKTNVKEIVKAADKAGMSYGQYVLKNGLY